MTTDPLVGRLVDGRYEVVSRIARGGMATVYLAVDRRLDREVALKVMHPHLADGLDGGEFVSRFRREARAAARLTHPGLVAVYDQGLDGETSYLTMEYVDGSNLRRVLRTEGTLTLGRTLAILTDVLDALAAAHRTGLVHRDIKPENVLIDTESRVKVADFGLARAVTEVTSTTTGTILGTVAYLGPELITTGACDTRTDVYATGILAYEMLTGAPPFTGDTPIQVAFQHVNSEVPPPSDKAPWLPVEIDDLVCALAARDPADRPVDASAALALVRRTSAALDPADLHRRIEAHTSPATSDGTTRRAAVGSQSAQEQPPGETTDGEPADGTEHGTTSALTALGPADLSEAGLTVRLTTGRTTAPPPAGSQHDTTVLARPRRRRRAALVWVLVLMLLVGGGGVGAAWWYSDGPGAFTTVPDGLLGVGKAEAESALADVGLRSTSTESFDDDVPVGAVVSTDPAPGDQVRKDGSVGLVISLGVEMLTVPDDLVGSSAVEAQAALQGARFEVGEPIGEHHDTVPSGEVLDVSVEEGSEQRHDTVVTLTVSSGPAPVTIPQVVNSAQGSAVATLEDRGLTVDVTEAHSESVAAGQVVSQDPEQGTEGHRGDTVGIVVSLGPPMVEVPNVYGQNVRTATAALEEAGFVVEVARPQGISPLNIVYSQDAQDADGDTAPKGSTVTINVF